MNKLLLIVLSASLAGCGKNSNPAPTASNLTSIPPASAQTENKALMEPAGSVYVSYLKIQSSLADDSTNGIAENAAAISKAVRGDSMKMLDPKVADQADALASAKDLAGAREAFKPLSRSLIEYLSKNGVPSGRFYEAYCPMAKASWLQADQDVKNP